MEEKTYKGKLTIDLMSVSRPVIRGMTGLAGGVLETPVQSALRVLKNLLEESREISRSEMAGEREDGFHEDWTFHVNNNIVGFIGDRGTGKSSCMLSTLKCMRESKDDGFSDCYFLQVIDPSFFDNNHNIIDLFVGELYAQFQKLVRHYMRERHDKRDIIMRLQKCFAGLKTNMHYFAEKPKLEDNFDEGNSLKLLASGVYMQSDIRKVIREFLMFVGKKRLVIAIDDLDLSVNRAYDMMEQIRKYLIIPEAVILFSAKIEQLQQAIQLRMMDIYKAGCDKLSMPVNFRDMADRYITKFLPLNHRVYMPDMTVMLDNELELINVGERRETVSFPNISDKVLDLIFHKTRYLFYNSSDHKSLIIPRNMRSLAHLVKMLWEMDDFDDSVIITTEGSDAARRNNDNKTRFRNYFFTDWLSRLNSDKDGKETSLKEETELLFFNKMVVEALTTFYYYDYNNELLETIADSNNAAANISIGDILTLLNDSRNRNSDPDKRLFLFFIESLYSMRLYESYDTMTDALKSETGITEEDSDRPILHGSGVSEIPDYLKLVGGSFFNPDPNGGFLPRERERRILDGAYISDEIRKLTFEYYRMKEDPDFIQDKLPDEFVARVRLMEFFIFCSQRRVQGKDRSRGAKPNDKYRLEKEAYYLSSFINVRNILFDVTSPLYNCIFPFKSIRRYSPDFSIICFEMDSPGKMSLSNRLLKENRKYGQDYNESADLASRLCLRNMEAIRDIHARLSERKNSYRPSGGGDMAIYRDFFNYLGSYEIDTYSLDETSSKYHKISLEPLKRLAETLKDAMTKKGLREIFENCFVPEIAEIPQKGTPAYNKIMRGYTYKPEDVRRIIFASYPEYKKNKRIVENLKFPKLKVSTGDEIMSYLIHSLEGFFFLDVFGGELQDEYIDFIIRTENKQKDNRGDE